MKKFLITMIALCAFAQVTHADVFENQNSENGYIVPHGPHQGPGPVRPGPRPEPYPGPGYPHPRPEPRPQPRPPAPYPQPPPQPYPQPYPQPHPGPGYPPPYGNIEQIRCDSYNYNYNQCYFNSFRVSSVNLIYSQSYQPCIYNQTYGISANSVWVSNGCSAVFEIVHY